MRMHTYLIQRIYFNLYISKVNQVWDILSLAVSPRGGILIIFRTFFNEMIKYFIARLTFIFLSVSCHMYNYYSW